MPWDALHQPSSQLSQNLSGIGEDMKKILRWLRSPTGRYVLFPVVFVFLEGVSPILGKLFVGNLSAALHSARESFTINSQPLWTGVFVGLTLAFLWRNKTFHRGSPR